MVWNKKKEDDDPYENEMDTPPRRSPRTKFREFDDDENAALRDYRSKKRSHRPKTGKDDIWPDADDGAGTLVARPSFRGVRCMIDISVISDCGEMHRL